MRHNKKKVVKVCEELTMFFFSVGADSISSKIEKESENYKVTFSSNYANEFRMKLSNLDKYLNCDQAFGSEEEYWALTGAGDMNEGSELMLIGMMSHDVHIDIQPSRVNLVLYLPTH